MFFIICLLASSLLLLLTTWFMICVIPSTKSAGAAGEVPLCGVWIMVLVLDWLLSSKFWIMGWRSVCLFGVLVVWLLLFPLEVVVLQLDGNMFGCGQGLGCCYVASWMLLCHDCRSCNGCKKLSLCILLSCGPVLCIWSMWAISGVWSIWWAVVV